MIAFQRTVKGGEVKNVEEGDWIRFDHVPGPLQPNTLCEMNFHTPSKGSARL
jgi:hypothetical protein